LKGNRCRKHETLKLKLTGTINQRQAIQLDTCNQSITN